MITSYLTGLELISDSSSGVTPEHSEPPQTATEERGNRKKALQEQEKRSYWRRLFGE